MLFCFLTYTHAHTHSPNKTVKKRTHNLKRNQQILKCKTKQRKAKTYEQRNKINREQNGGKKKTKNHFLFSSCYFFEINRFWCKGKSPYVLVPHTVRKPLTNVWVAHWVCDSVLYFMCVWVSAWLGSYVKNLILFRGKLHK